MCVSKVQCHLVNFCNFLPCSALYLLICYQAHIFLRPVASYCHCRCKSGPAIKYTGKKSHPWENGMSNPWLQLLHICSREKSASVDKLPRHVKFTFKNPVRCCIIWVTLRLQGPGSASVNLGMDFSLLSVDEDENPFALLDWRVSFGGAVEVNHLFMPKELGLTSSQSSE